MMAESLQLLSFWCSDHFFHLGQLSPLCPGGLQWRQDCFYTLWLLQMTPVNQAHESPNNPNSIGQRYITSPRGDTAPHSDFPSEVHQMENELQEQGKIIQPCSDLKLYQLKCIYYSAFEKQGETHLFSLVSNSLLSIRLPTACGCTQTNNLTSILSKLKQLVYPFFNQGIVCL